MSGPLDAASPPGWDDNSPLEAAPVIKSARLVMDGLRQEDREAYNRLCLDDARNRWWGYDYREDLKGPWTEDFFLESARADFQNRREASFAVRREGRFTGEVVLHHFDGAGGAELGCRILPEYAGQGCGAEAFRRMADWCLQVLGLERVRGKCRRENAASRRMLARCMDPAGEDGTFLYFERRRPH